MLYIFAVCSELLRETIPILDDGSGPTEYYRIVELVTARNREQARYLAWATDKNFDSNVRDMPNFRTRKLGPSPLKVQGLCSDIEGSEQYWRSEKVIGLCDAADNDKF